MKEVPRPAMPDTHHALRDDTPRAIDASTAIYLSEVDVNVGLQPILRNIDMVVRRGEAVALTGANGSGKTTLLRVLATLLRPAGGTVRLLGRSFEDAARPAQRSKIALVGHRTGLSPDLTVLENLELIALLVGVDPARAAAELDRVGLAGAAGRRVQACSEGMVRRAELARVWLTQPSLLLLDEAHGALDADARSLVASVTEMVMAAGGAAVLVTHAPEALAGFVNRELRLCDGQLAEARL